jgi:SAM-dependent methyltransferase
MRQRLNETSPPCQQRPRSSLHMLRTRLGEARRYLRLAWRSLWRSTPPVARRHSDAELLQRTAEFNAAAERQYQVMNADAERRDYLLEKPFAGLQETPAMLYRLGLALEALDLGLGHTVLDFGSGSCWLSVILNRLRCRTISMDVSQTALGIGREALARDPHARAELEPQFLVYDGHRIPLPDEAVDRIVCFDSFHHVPNQDEVLAEMFRVLRTGGRVVMAEPGEGHARAEASVFEAQHFGVLENDLLLEELLERVERAGFVDVQVKPYPDVPILALSGKAHLRLLAGDGSVFPMQHMIDSLKQFHVLILFKGRAQRDSRNPGLLRARIDVEGPALLAGEAGRLARLAARVENTGDTSWLAAENRVTGGYVSFGGHLFDAHGRPIRIGYLTAPLPHDVRPGESVRVEFGFGLPEQAGRFTLRLDLVVDQVAWFSQRGSPTTDLEMSVEWADSRDPHRFEARIEPVGPFPPQAEGGAFPLRLRLTNAGDTIWLPGASAERGTVRVGVQRLAADEAVAERDYFRLPLPVRVAPGETTEVEGAVPCPAGSGGRFAVDLVAEGICWFAHHGSRLLVFTVQRPAA